MIVFCAIIWLLLGVIAWIWTVEDRGKAAFTDAMDFMVIVPCLILAPFIFTATTAAKIVKARKDRSHAE